jgi:phage I-like protein
MHDLHEEHMEPQSDLDATEIHGSLLDGFDAPLHEMNGGEPMNDIDPMDASALLDQLEDTPDMLSSAPADVAEVEMLPEPEHVAEIPGIDGDVATAMAASAAVAGVALAASASSPEQAPTQMPEAMRDMLEQGQKNIEEFQQKLAELKTQVIGGSITVVSIQGQLAEKDQVIADLDLRLQASEAEAATLREELLELRTALEAGLTLRSEEEEKASTVLKERLALLEDRQDQAARDMQAEIERAVPREAAKVIREEITALASTLHD